MGNKEKEEEVMATPSYEKLDYATLDSYYAEVVRQIANTGMVPDVVIALSRGGLDFGVKLSHYYDNCDLVPLVWQTRDGALKQEDLLHDTLKANSGANVLVVDDILDSGETLQQIEAITDIYAGNVSIYFAAAIANLEADIQADFMGREIHRSEDTQWFVFPFENWWQK